MRTCSVGNVVYTFSLTDPQVEKLEFNMKTSNSNNNDLPSENSNQNELSYELEYLWNEIESESLIVKLVQATSVVMFAAIAIAVFAIRRSIIRRRMIDIAGVQSKNQSDDTNGLLQDLELGEVKHNTSTDV